MSPKRCRSRRAVQAAEELAENAHLRVADEFLGDRHLEQYAALFEQLRERRR
jgi:hypothetical protein